MFFFRISWDKIRPISLSILSVCGLDPLFDPLGSSRPERIILSTTDTLSGCPVPSRPGALAGQVDAFTVERCQDQPAACPGQLARTLAFRAKRGDSRTLSLLIRQSRRHFALLLALLIVAADGGLWLMRF